VLFERSAGISAARQDMNVQNGASVQSSGRVGILLVDDNPSNLLALEALLEPLGQDLVRATCGREALDHIAQREFAVVLMDVRLPGLDGFQIVARIREQEPEQRTPIIFITADATEETHARVAYSQGAVDFLVKPINPGALVSKVAVFVDLYLRGERIRAQEAALRRAEREALERKSESRLETIIDLMPLCVVALHADGTPYYWNRAWRDYTGIGLDDASLETLLDAVHPDDRLGARETLRRALETGRAVEIECRLRDGRVGSYHWHVARALPDVNADGNVVGWIATATDVERQKQAEREAKQANRMKDEFLAVVSHDLRTPLTSILGWAGMLSSGTAEPPKLRRGLETIQRNARVQARLIDDILDFARIISGKLSIERRAVDIRTVVQTALEVVHPAAEAKGVRVEAVLQPVPITSGDPDRLQQVIGNLVTNAIKFTPAGGRIEVSVRSAGDGIDIQVRDTGRGIDAEFLPHVFDRFRQGNATTGGGLGLGLAIVRHIVQLHQGTVTAESEGVGHGSTFVVRLPVRSLPGLADSPTPRAVDASAPQGTPARVLRGVRILVLDDDADSRELLGQVLGGAGAEVIGAPTFREAIDILEHSTPDVLLSDIALPGKDGYAFIREVRARPRDNGGSIPAAALTAYTRPQDASLAREAGFDVHVAKPVEPFEIVDVVADLVRLRHHKRSRDF
jgi:PAS domain S-box-containing protein